MLQGVLKVMYRYSLDRSKKSKLCAVLSSGLVFCLEEFLAIFASYFELVARGFVIEYKNLKNRNYQVVKCFNFLFESTHIWCQNRLNIHILYSMCN